MDQQKEKKRRQLRRRNHVRRSIVGTPERPRLTVFRSSKHIYAQLVDDLHGVTLAAASSCSPDVQPTTPYGGNVKAATVVGKKLAEVAKTKGIAKAAFDRGHYRYHGRIKALAEQEGVTICVELLNSKVDHAGYQGDRTAFGVAVVRGVNSPRVKLLYDIYHMQIMEGDVIHTIRDNAQRIAHYHTGGVPGRHEIDGTQELNYRAIAQAIVDTGYAGYMAHEFQPVRDPLTSLREAVELCNV